MDNSGFWYVIGIIVVAGLVGRMAQKWRRETVEMTADELRPEIRAVAEIHQGDERRLSEIREAVRTVVREEMRAVLNEWGRSVSQTKQPWDR